MTEKQSSPSEANEGHLGDLDDLVNASQEPAKLVGLLMKSLGKIAEFDDKIATLGEKMTQLAQGAAKESAKAQSGSNGSDSLQRQQSTKDKGVEVMGYRIEAGNRLGRNPFYGHLALFFLVIVSVATALDLYWNWSALGAVATATASVILVGSIKAYAQKAIDGEKRQRESLEAQNEANKVALIASTRERVELRDQITELMAANAILKAKVKKLKKLIQTYSPDLMDKTGFVDQIQLEKNKAFVQSGSQTRES